MSIEYFEKVLAKALKTSITEALADSRVRREAVSFVRREIRRLKADPNRIHELLEDLAVSILFSLATDVVVFAILEVYGEEANLRKNLADAVSNAVTGKALERFLKECNIGYAISRFGQEEVEKTAQKVTTEVLSVDEEFLTLTEEVKKILSEALSSPR